MKKVLVVEDDPNIADLISLNLTDSNYQTKVAKDGEKGLVMAEDGSFDLIILDLMLPKKDGMDVCQSLRRKQVDTPILMLTAKSEEIDKVLGLESGADDYMTKPFSIRELLARVKAIMRRTSAEEKKPNQEKQRFEFDGLTIDKEKRNVEAGNSRVELTPKEFDLLILLVNHPGRTYSRQSILNQVWGYEFSGYEHTVNSHINRLRVKIEPDISDPKYILTTWGVGYRFNDQL